MTRDPITHFSGCYALVGQPDGSRGRCDCGAAAAAAARGAIRADVADEIQRLGGAPGKPASLSPTMEAAILAARNGGENRLYRWPGGYWLPLRRPAGAATPAYGTSHGTQTVMALLVRGIFREVECMRRGDPWIVELVESVAAPGGKGVEVESATPPPLPAETGGSGGRARRIKQ